MSDDKHELEERIDQALEEDVASAEEIKEAFESDGYSLHIPKEVLEGIDDIVEGRTMDGDDLDDALSWINE